MPASVPCASGHKLYFYANPCRDDAASRMGIDFLIAKAAVTNRHNISPIEVKSSARYTLSSLRKLIKKYPAQLHTPYVVHPADLKVEEGITFIPLYMVPFL